MMINENLIDIVINPSDEGESAKLTWRPQVPGYSVENQVKTVAKDGALDLEITSDDSGSHFIVKGTVPLGQKDIVRTASIDDPNEFARSAFIEALKNAGVKVNVPAESKSMSESLDSYKDRQQVALWTSPPLSEYAKLILKVSHNTGANLSPLLLASHDGKKTFEQGLQLIGKFIMDAVKLSPNEFVILDGAGGNENRFTPQAEVKLLEYMQKQSPEQFKSYMNDLPILGVDGSLEDFAKNTDAVGKVFAKPGTGIAFNAGTGKLFLITQALGGYVKGKNGHIIAYMLAVNNGEMPSIDDVFGIFEDVSQLSSMIYDNSDKP
jgi:D-alanyl-D-alanine carboxypeptidase/D-alanyl-D-alanine-endopeptidase (penicillin-binding protein 4)